MAEHCGGAIVIVFKQAQEVAHCVPCPTRDGLNDQQGSADCRLYGRASVVYGSDVNADGDERYASDGVRYSEESLDGSGCSASRWEGLRMWREARAAVFQKGRRTVAGSEGRASRERRWAAEWSREANG